MSDAPAPSAPRANRLWPSLLSRVHWLLFPGLALVLLWNTVTGQEALLPARFLQQMVPWSAETPSGQPVPWNPLIWDGIAQFYPWRLFAARCFEQGEVPLWNPYQFCGTPFLADSQSAPLYPLHLLYYLPLGTPVVQRMAWLAAIHLTLAGAFTCAWARDLGARPAAAALAGALFMTSGPVITWLELPSFLSTGCWIPLLLLSLGRALSRGSWGWSAVAMVALGCMLLGGHLQIAFYGLLAAALLGAWTVAAAFGAIRRARDTDSPARVQRPGPAIALGAGIAIVAAGVCLAAAQLLPALELSRLSHRVAAPSATGYESYIRLALPLQHLVTLLVPDFFGHPLRGGYYGPGNYSEYAAYLGLPGLALGLVGITVGRRVSASAPYLSLLALLSLALALGVGLNRLLYFRLPGFAQSGSPARILILFCLALAVLAALGAEALLRAQERAHLDAALQRTIACVAAFVIALLLAQTWSAEPMAAALSQHLYDRYRSLPFPAAAGDARDAAVLEAWLMLAAGVALPALGLILQARGRCPPRMAWRAIPALALVSVAAGIARFAPGFNPTAPLALVYPRKPLINRLTAMPAGGRIVPVNNDWSLFRTPRVAAPPNAWLVYGLLDAQGYDSLFLGRYKLLLNAAMGEGQDASPAENGNIVFCRRLDGATASILGIRWAIAPEPLHWAGARLLTSQDGLFVYAVVDRVPLARFARESRRAPDPDAATAMRSLAASDPARFARIAWLPPGAATPALSAGTAQWEIVGSGRRQVRVHGGDSGLLLLTENFAPGWRAFWHQGAAGVVPLPVERANVSFQAVQLPGGDGTLQLRYEPESFRVGLFLSLLALAGLLGGSSGWLVRRRRMGRSSTVSPA